VSWVENGDLIEVTTQGLTTDQVAMFVNGLAQTSRDR